MVTRTRTQALTARSTSRRFHARVWVGIVMRIRRVAAMAWPMRRSARLSWSSVPAGVGKSTVMEKLKSRDVGASMP